MTYILSYTGRKVGVDVGAPALLDVAIGMSRQPRFGGQGRRWWSVLDHSFFVAGIAQQYGCTAAERLAALLHDGHEGVTGDVPSPFKPPQLSMLQRSLDSRLELPRVNWHLIKAFDTRALHAEACVVGPECLATPEDVEEHFGRAPFENDVALLLQGMRLRWWGFPPRELVNTYLHVGVQRFLSHVQRLREEIRHG